MIYEWRFFGLARLVSDDLCLLPSPSFGPGLGVRDWSNFHGQNSGSRPHSGWPVFMTGQMLGLSERARLHVHVAPDPVTGLMAGAGRMSGRPAT